MPHAFFDVFHFMLDVTTDEFLRLRYAPLTRHQLSFDIGTPPRSACSPPAAISFFFAVAALFRLLRDYATL